MSERPTKTKPEGIERATGRGRQEWFGILDDWGAKGRPFREIADWLTGEHGMTFWWAQKLIVEYEQDRGIRPAGVRPDGTFTVGASKAVDGTVEKIAAAFTDPSTRERWLPGLGLTVRQEQPGKRIRFDVDDGTRLHVQFFPAAGGRTTVAVEHERLPDAETAEATKAMWRERLEALRSTLGG
jgi:hypothetical protein